MRPGKVWPPWTVCEKWRQAVSAQKRIDQTTCLENVEIAPSSLEATRADLLRIPCSLLSPPSYLPSHYLRGDGRETPILKGFSMDSRDSGWMYSNRPHEDESKFGIPIIKVKAGVVTAGVMVAPDVIGVYTHYWSGYTTPCMAENCFPCEKLSPRLWHGYFPIYSPSKRGRGIVEVPASAAKFFDEQLQRYGTCEGYHVALTRVGNNDAGRVHVAFTRKAEEIIDLPPFPNTREYLHKLWRISTSGGRGQTTNRGKKRFKEGGNNDAFGVVA